MSASGCPIGCIVEVRGRGDRGSSLGVKRVGLRGFDGRPEGQARAGARLKRGGHAGFDPASCQFVANSADTFSLSTCAATAAPASGFRTRGRPTAWLISLGAARGFGVRRGHVLGHRLTHAYGDLSSLLPVHVAGLVGSDDLGVPHGAAEEQIVGRRVAHPDATLSVHLVEGLHAVRALRRRGWASISGSPPNWSLSGRTGSKWTAMAAVTLDPVTR